MNIIPKHNPPRTENISFLAKFSEITVMTVKAKRIGSKSVLPEHKYYSIAKDCYLGKHSDV